MSSPRRLTKSQSRSRDRGAASEPFPSYPASSPQSPQAGSSNPQDNTLSTTTSVTTTTVVDGRNDPVTVTSTQFPQVNGAPANPPSIITGPGEQAPIPFTQTTVNVPSVVRRRPIGIRRLPSASNYPSQASTGDGPSSRSGSGRRRSASDPAARLNVAGGGSTRVTRQTTREPGLSTLREEPQAHQQGQTLQVPGQDDRQDRSQTAAGSGAGRRRSVSNTARSVLSKFSNEGSSAPQENYEDGIVDYLDVIGMPNYSYPVSLF